MSTATETVTVSELEEMLSNDVPCGGNTVPENVPCPHNAAAVLVSSHLCPMTSDPKEFKCVACYEVWLAHVLRKTLGKGNVNCRTCSWRGLAWGLYRPL